jgi:Flp pilus assembly protein TadD
MKAELEDLFADGQFRLMDDDFAGSIAIFTEVLEKDPQCGRAYQARAIARLKAGDAEDALVDIDAAIRCEPDNARFRYHKATVLIQKNAFDEALESLSRAIDLEPGYPPPYLLRGKVYERLGEEELANADISQAMTLRKEGTKVVDY